MANEFDRRIRDPNQSVAVDLSYRNRPLLIAFGGISGGLGVPPFEFFKATEDLDVNKIWLRDLSQSWYHSGQPSVSRNINGTARFLRRMVDKLRSDHVVIFGNSMGGYAAILFGILINADAVHAFSPHTNITSSKDIRYKDKLRYVHDNFSNKFFDLRSVMRSTDYLCDFNLYFGSQNKLDKKHAMHLEGEQNVTLNSYDFDGHGLIKVLKKSGELRNIIISSINNAPRKSSSANA